MRRQPAGDAKADEALRFLRRGFDHGGGGIGGAILIFIVLKMLGK